MNVIVCDGERTYREAVADKVMLWAKESRHTAAVMIYQFSSSEDLLEQWEHGLQIDMLFIDILISFELDGLKTAKTIFEKNEQIPIAFITNYTEYACEGYSVNALRYILKPIRQEAISECMRIAWNRWELAQSESLRIAVGKRVEYVPLQQIMMIESLSHHLLFTTTSGRCIDAYGSFHQYTPNLPAVLFGQCHKSYIVNVMYVRRIQSDRLFLSNGTSIPIGRKYAPSFFQSFNQYHQGRY